MVHSLQRSAISPNLVVLFLLRSIGKASRGLLTEYLRGAEPEELRGRSGISSEIDALLRDDTLYSEAESSLREFGSEGIQVLGIHQKAYPSPLRELHDPPFLLYYRGAPPEEWVRIPKVAIVGSRKVDSEGVRVAQLLSQGIAELGNCVVSGLALGTDAAAHRGAVRSPESTVPTIAVLGNGLRHVYPRTNKDIYQEILEAGGSIISQFHPDMRPFPANFLNRNQIIAGLSLGVIVIRAAKRSGALATARYALELGRDVLAVPGSVLSPICAGTNELIRNGAAVVTCCDDVLDELSGLSRQKKTPAVEQAQATGILAYLAEHGATSIDDLGDKFSAVSNVAAELLEFELDGLLERLPGNSVRLVPKLVRVR